MLRTQFVLFAILFIQFDVIFGWPLARIFEKCEVATCADGREHASESLKEDIELFVKGMRAEMPDRKADPEVDSLMVQAILVLRLHLLEMRKVHRTCIIICMSIRVLQGDILPYAKHPVDYKIKVPNFAKFAKAKLLF